MDWLLSSPQLHSAFSSLGSQRGDAYVVSTDALATLEEINYKLTYEDQTLRTFRRSIGFGQNVRSDLIPLLENTKDENILDLVIRILVNLTVPVECLFSVDVMYRTELGRHTVFELNKLLYTSKEAFTDPKSTKSVVEYMKHILESESKLSAKKCDQINNCLLLLRNILHIPELNGNHLMPSTPHNQAISTHPVSIQNAILWNLFIQSIDKLLIHLMTCPQRAIWGVTMVQLIALLYKDQHAGILQKLLNLWFDASLSESSEDNESNTSPPKQGSCDSSPMLTSDPTSDSSDNGKCRAHIGLGIPMSTHSDYWHKRNKIRSLIGSKNGTSQERRQALREETDATLQEVSRKGQEYQDSMLRVSADKVDNGSEEATDCEEAFVTTKAQQIVKLTDPPPLKEEDKSKKASSKVVPKQQQQNQEPAESNSSTSNVVSNEAHFMPPPALPKKSTKPITFTDPELLEATPQAKQKTPHSAHVELTKGVCCPKKRECPSSQSELSDCGYATQVENHESISTSSNDDDSPQSKPQHQKPPCNSKARNKPRALLMAIDSKDLRRKKLVKRSKSSLINMKGLVVHSPSDDDITNLLKEFTVDFLLKGYGNLVDELHTQLLVNLDIPIDTSHFFWLVTYFLKFAAQLELDMEHINTILSFDVISYITYEGVMLCEQLELNSRQGGSDLSPYLRRMHLAVSAIREFLQAIETYKKSSHLSEDDREYLRELQLQISGSEDIRNLFVLLLRRFNPSLHSKIYLQDLVVTNHALLMTLDGVTKTNNNIHMKMMDHISQFATLEVMYYYGILLEDFRSNGEFVNNCIFTMMHHVGGDLEKIGTLFQPSILKTFSHIWEIDYELCEDWSDLVEYVIHTFIHLPAKNPLALPPTSLTELTKEHNLENTVCTWSQEEMDTLYWYHVQSKKSKDVVGQIIKLITNNGCKVKSRISIIQQLLQQDIISLVEYDDLMKFEDATYQRTLLTTPTSVTTESGIELKDAPKSKAPSDDIQNLRDLIIKDKKQQQIVWIQKLLLECCYIKLILKEKPLREDHLNLSVIMEPMAYHSILTQKSIPVVNWNNEQAATMMYQPFVLLLHKMGFQLPADAGSVFARIPVSWSVEKMFNLAKKLGPLDKLFVKFDVHQFDTVNDSEMPLSMRSHLDASATRNSSRSMSSVDVEANDSDELATIPEVDDILEKTSESCEIFAVPNAKHSNSIIRYTPEPTSIPSIPNWLQLVMRNKCNNSNCPTTSTKASAAASASLANLATNATNDSEIWMAKAKTAAVSTTDNVAATRDTCNNIALETTTVTSALKMATTSAIALQSTTATLLSCPSINNIIGQQQQHHETIGNNNDCYYHRKQQISNEELEFPTSLNTLTTTALTVATTLTTNALTIPLSTALLSTSSSLVAIATVPTAESTATITETTSLAVNFKDYHQLHDNHHHHHNHDDEDQLQHQQLQQLEEIQQITYLHHSDDDDSAMRSLGRNDSSASSGFCTRSGSGNLEQELCAMVANAYEQDNANDSASVASDLTRMYVSDEEHEYRVPHYH